MVTVGFAVTVAPVVALNPVDGDHEYVEAPFAKRDTELPEHIIAEEGVTLTVGNGFTVTNLLVKALRHPFAEVLNMVTV